ncbi:N-succinylarginine dihydrolase, partial [Escherichia coli]|uniref:N-succinylarginine dihydrolase n=1 Tax=Escherichia coli TaxID=562 RepID=UPI0028E0796F
MPWCGYPWARGLHWTDRPCRLRNRAMAQSGTSQLTEITFDGIVGPSHNYAGLSLGNIASASHAGDPSYPRAAALQ